MLSLFGQPLHVAEFMSVGIYYVKQMSSIDMVVLKSSYLEMTQPYLTHSFFLRILLGEKREVEPQYEVKCDLVSLYFGKEEQNEEAF